MYEISRNYKLVNGKEIETWKAEFVNANILGAEVGTNGYQGGDTGHGSRTYLKIEDLGCTDITAKCSDGIVEIELGGDTELHTLIQALEFLLQVLKEQIKENEARR